MAESNIRGYVDADYDQIRALYAQSEIYGGQFDDARDGREMLAAEVEHDPEAILIYEEDMAIAGTVSLIVTQRMAMLFRFAVRGNDQEVAAALYGHAAEILHDRGYPQVLVYSPVGNAALDARYVRLGMNKGGDYTCYWQET